MHSLARTFRPLFALLAAATLIQGCATNTMTGRSQLKIVSAESAISQAASSYAGMMKEYRKEDKILENDPRVSRVRGIANRLIDQAVAYRPDSAKWAWSVVVLDEDKTVNAFCMPGRRMAVYTGLLGKVKPTDDELAQVMGHEIGHALADHGAEKMSVGILTTVAAAGASVAVKEKYQDLTYGAATLAAMAFVNLPNSRTAEDEADRIGIELAARAGYNPAAGATLWQKMMKASGGNSRFDLLSTHPAPPKRIDMLRSLEPRMQELYKAAGSRPVPARIAWVSTKPGARDPDIIRSLTEGNAKRFQATRPDDAATPAASHGPQTVARSSKQAETRRVSRQGDTRPAREGRRGGQSRRARDANKIEDEDKDDDSDADEDEDE